MIIPSATITIHLRYNELEILLATHYFLSIFVVTKKKKVTLINCRIRGSMEDWHGSFVVNNRVIEGSLFEGGNAI